MFVFAKLFAPENDMLNILYASSFLLRVRNEDLPDQIMGQGYAFFQKILGGASAEHYQDSLVVTNNILRFEHVLTKRALRRAYTGKIISGEISQYVPGDVSLGSRMLDYSHQYALIECYNYTPSNPVLSAEFYKDSWMFPVIFIGICYKLKLRPSNRLLIMGLAPAAACLPLILELWDALPSAVIFCMVATLPFAKSSFYKKGVIFISLPPTLKYLSLMIGNANISIDVRCMLTCSLVFGLSQLRKLCTWVSNLTKNTADYLQNSSSLFSKPVNKKSYLPTPIKQKIQKIQSNSSR